MCGFCKYKISSGAPAFTNVSSTKLTNKSFVRDVNLPSEKVPAPPSPNCTLEFLSSTPVLKNLETANALESTSPPRSKIIGLSPARAKIKAVNIPAGPNPTTTGLYFKVRESLATVKTLGAGIFSRFLSRPKLIFPSNSTSKT